MNAKIEDLMVSTVMFCTRHQSVGHAKKLMNEHGIHALPIVDAEHEPVGIVTSSDLMRDLSEATPLSSIMSTKVFTVPKYSDVSLAARVMRNQHVHHVVVTHEKRLVGLLSSYDLLQLVENHRFVMKNAPTENSRRGKRGQEREPE